MSSVTASTIRLLEQVLDKIRRGGAELGLSIPKALEYVAVKSAVIGERIEDRVVSGAKRLARIFDYLQRSLYEALPLSSLLVGVLFTIAILIIALISVVR